MGQFSMTISTVAGSVLGDNQHAMRNLIDRDSVTRLKKRYRKLSSIEGYWGGDPNRLRTNLQARGVFPVWNPADANAEFYRIADI